MAERFENLDNILRGWAIDKPVQRSFVGALNRYEYHEEERKSRVSF